MTRPEQLLAGNTRTLTWTITLGALSPALSTASTVALRTDADGTESTIDPADITVTPTADGATVDVVVYIDDDTPRGRVTIRLDIDQASGKPLYAGQGVIDVMPASAQRAA